MRFREWVSWCSSPLRACRGLFPFTTAGRQTLIYLIFAGAGPALTMFVLWAMKALRDAKQWDWFGKMALYVLGGSLFILICALACFISIRAVKLGKDGIELGGWHDEEVDPATKGAVETAQAAVQKAVEINERTDGPGGNV